MRSVSFGILTLAITVSLRAAFDFKGDALGMPMADFVLKHDRETIDSGRRAPHIIIQSLSKNPTSYRRVAMVVIEKYFGFEERDEPKTTVAGVPARVTYNFFASSLLDWDLATAPRREQDAAIEKVGYTNMSERLKFVNPRAWTEEERLAAGRLKLGTISIYFSKDSFLQVLGALTEKYGPPASETSVPKQNAMGAAFSSRVVKWTSDEDMIEMTEISYDIKTTHLVFSRRSVLDQAKAASQLERKADAKDL
jgi:hypothetical protein